MTIIIAVLAVCTASIIALDVLLCWYDGGKPDWLLIIVQNLFLFFLSPFAAFILWSHFLFVSPSLGLLSRPKNPRAEWLYRALTAGNKD